MKPHAVFVTGNAGRMFVLDARSGNTRTFEPNADGIVRLVVKTVKGATLRLRGDYGLKRTAASHKVWTFSIEAIEGAWSFAMTACQATGSPSLLLTLPAGHKSAMVLD